MEDEPQTFDVMDNCGKKGTAFNVNPIIIDTDSQCEEMLMKLISSMKLSHDETLLLKSCISVVTSNDGDTVSFGPREILDLASLCQRNPKFSTEISACSHHLAESIDYQGEIPNGFFLETSIAYNELSEIMAAALQSGPITSSSFFEDEDDYLCEDGEDKDDYQYEDGEDYDEEEVAEIMASSLQSTLSCTNET
jgi:hypothetical protein